MMYIHDATEEAYKNGYEKGAREVIQEIAKGCTLKDTCCNTEFVIGYLTAMNEVLYSLAKLKQKYTEKNDD